MTSSRRASPPALAIVGLACRLPGAPDPHAFWRLLAEGRDAVTWVPPERFTQPAWLHPRRGEAGRSYTFAAGVLDDVLGFDAAAFGLSPREAAEMDPQQRLVLELAREAFEDAGWPEASVAGSATGVYIGASTTDWSDLRQFDPGSADRFIMTGSALSVIANRLTNVFDLHGPAQVIDTACSSGLVALHQAAEALRAGRIPAAVVGGVNMLLSPGPFAGFSRAGMLSPNGRCHAFDARADGYVRAEGGVVLVLKRLDDALAAGERVHGVLLATAVNAAGRTVGLSLPNGAAQSALLEGLLAETGLDPTRIRAFEAHGTGTAAGDPIEAAAIGRAIAAKRGGAPLLLGSAKTNIGHTEAASGLVGLTKALLMLRHGQVPPSLHFETPNPQIDFGALGLRVNTALRPLPGRADAVVGVNSFGFGGTNAAALVGPAPPAPRPRGASTRLPPLVLSARSAGALAGLAARWAERLDGARPADAAAALAGQLRHRDLLPHRLVARGARPADLARRLRAWTAAPDNATPDTAGLTAGIAPHGRGVAFAFSGNGAQWPGMAQAAMARSGSFRQAVRSADRHLRPLLGWSVARALAEGVEAERLADTDHAQPLLFAVQLGVVAALAEGGVAPIAVVGHSVGEVAAAHVAGLLSLPAACRLIVTRSRHQQTTRGQGRMAALGAAPHDALPVLAECSDPGEPALEIAAINGPAALTVAGPPAALARLDAAARERRWSFIPLDLEYAFHSAYMAPVRAGLLRDLRSLRSGPPRIPMVSSVTGEMLPACPPGYWWRNLREPVAFAAALARLAQLQPRLVIEIGPNPVLLSYLREGLRAAGSEANYTHSLSRRDAAGDPMPGMLDRAVALGATPAIPPGPASRDLPRAPQQRTPTPMPHSVERVRVADPIAEHPLLGERRSVEAREWTRLADLALDPWLADHRLAGEAVLPAAAMAEMALAAAAARHPEAPALELSELLILRPVPLERDRTRELRSRLSDEGRFTLESRRRLSDEPWLLHAQGQLAALPRLPAAPDAPPADGEPIEGAAITAAAARLGLDYGPAFRPVQRVVLAGPQAGGEHAALAAARATLALPAEAPADAGFLLHPVRLDGAMQGIIGLLAGAGVEAGQGFVPVRLARLCLRRGAPPPASADIRLAVRGERSAAADIVLRDGAGTAVAILEGCWVQRLRLPGRADPGQDLFHLAMVPVAGGLEPAPPVALAAARAALAAVGTEDIGDAALLLEAYATVASDTELPPAGDIWRQVLLERPGLAHELAWLAEAADPAARPGLPPPDAAGLHMAARALAEAAGAIADAWPAGRPLRVLEIGAGPGPLTGLLARRLAASGRRVLLHAATLPGARPPAPPMAGVEFTASEWDPLGGEPPPSVADLTLGLLVELRLRAAAPAGDATLAAALRQASPPGGALLLAEAAPGALWEATLGRDPAWAAAPPLPDAEAWMQALAEAGWDDAAVCPLAGSVLPLAVVSARAAQGAVMLPAGFPRRVVLVGEGALRGPLALLAQARRAEVVQCTLEDAAVLSPRALRGALLVLLPGREGEGTPGEHSVRLAQALAGFGRLAATAQGAVAGCLLVTERAATTPAAAAMQGLGRVLANEMPALRLRRVDIAPGLPPAEAARRVLAEALPDADAEAEVTLGPEARFAPRMRPGLPAPPPAPGARQLAVGQPGQLSSLHWVAMPQAMPGPGEVRLRVEAAGLNFRDLMWAQGLLPEEALLPGFAGPGLGIECAGVVEAVGAGVAWRPGEQVFGFAPRALAGQALTRAEALVRRPPGLSPAAAASLPVAFMTAVHALEELARIEPGEVVLLHGAAGAVGLAALQVAQGAGARVVATAGTPARRAFLREAGAELVLDSRDPGFADALRAAGLDGVDVALNSLAGEAMERTLGLMRPFGRFVELGKRDYAENRRVALRPLRRNVAYFAVDVDELPRARPAVAARLLAGIVARLESGVFRPLPHRAVAADAVEEAFRAMQAGSHIGKLVIVPPAPVEARPGAGWRPEATVDMGVGVVVGGGQGFGLEAARWLAAQGVRRLALLSRRGTDPGLEGARAYAVDATDAAALGGVLARVRAELGPIGAVVHAAAVFDDATAAALDAARVARVLAAKLDVAENLDRLTADDPLRLFLLFGSATVPVGSPGQAAYVAANAGLAALARRRQAAGRPALCVEWGPVSDTGVLAGDGASAAGLARRLGAVALPAAASLAQLPAMLDGGLPVAGMARIQWQQGAAALPVLREPVFAAVQAGVAAAAADGADLRERCAALPDEAALGLLREAVRGELARILRLPASGVASDAPLPALGLDSLGGMELRSALERRLGAAVAISAVTEEMTVETLARGMLEGLRGGAGDAALAARIAAHEPEPVAARNAAE